MYPGTPIVCQSVEGVSIHFNKESPLKLMLFHTSALTYTKYAEFIRSHIVGFVTFKIFLSTYKVDEI